MPFNSITFLVLFPAVLVGLALLPGRWRNGFLLVASYVFYGCWDYRFLLLLFATTVIDFWVGLEIAAARDAVVLALDIPQNISGDHTVFLRLPWWVQSPVYAAACLAMILYGGKDVPFIYFQF